MAKKELLKEYEGDESNKKEVSRSDFPPNFFFGVATSAYQVEGAYKEGGSGPSIWDAFSHTEGKIVYKSNGDVAVDQYHRYKEDVELIAKLGFEYYRFSISWSRIFPDGLGTKINDEGINYYNNLINALLEKDTCFASFGDRVKIWITINEPLQTAVNGYDMGGFAPGRCQGSSIEPYLAAHHQILAHAAAVSIYRSKYKDKQGGQVGLVLDCEWAEANSENK
uniref:Beta-glucosidase n=1 Tax=Quercus lobata TaxID=97700 RepID=A0A7N2R4M7_QUELO